MIFDIIREKEKAREKEKEIEKKRETDRERKKERRPGSTRINISSDFQI